MLKMMRQRERERERERERTHSTFVFANIQRNAFQSSIAPVI